MNICSLKNSKKDFFIDFIKNQEDIILIEVININDFKSEFKFNTFYDVITAKIGSILYTFLNCNFLEYGDIKTTYKVEGYFIGIHINNLDLVKIKSYSFYIPDSMMSLFGKTIKNQENYRSSKIEFVVNDNFSIKFDTGIKETPIDLLYSYKTKVYTGFTFNYKKEVFLSDVYGDLNIFKQFLSFNIGIESTLNPYFIEILKDKSYILDTNQYNYMIEHEDDCLRFYHKIIRFNSNSNISDKLIRNKCFNALFKNLGYNNEVFNIITEWYKNNKYQTIYSFYIDSNDWLQGTNRLITNIMFNNKFLNMVQALENYHKILFKESKVDNEDYDKNTGKYINQLGKLISKDNELYSWITTQLKKIKGKRECTLKERLDKLLSINMCETENLHFHNYSTDTKNFRDNLSHGNLIEINQGKSLELCYYQSKYLLICCILKSLNLSSPRLKVIIESNYNFYYIRDRIKQLY